MKKVHLIQADITAFAVHAIVNSANKSLLGGGGLDYVIHKKAGPLMKAECIKLNQEKGGCPTGQAEVTTAGNLPAKYLIHAVGPRWLDGERNEPQLLCDAYSNALMRANEIGAKTVSFPNISTGVYGFPRQLAAQIAIGTICSILPQHDQVAEVFFVCRDAENYLIYKEILSMLDDPKIQIKISSVE
jgi:O-acetyl-ADP-ribose deacetylase (regulator of RNase III)